MDKYITPGRKYLNGQTGLFTQEKESLVIAKRKTADVHFTCKHNGTAYYKFGLLFKSKIQSSMEEA